MAQVSVTLRKWTGGYLHYCPGCGQPHSFRTVAKGNEPQWQFDGDVIKPTFSPSMKVTWNDRRGMPQVCHYFLRAGQIEFLTDSTHGLSGQTVALPALPEGMRGDNFQDG